MSNKIWNNLSEDYENQFYITEYILLPAVLNELNDAKGKSVLDVGCGTGYFSEILYRKGAHVIGLDSSEKMIEIAKTRNPEIKYVNGEAENLSEYIKYINKKFDYVIIVMFFCCVDNRSNFEKIFNEVKKVLKENGKIIIIDYHPKGYKNLDTFLLKHKFPENFNYLNSPQKFKVELRNKKDKLLKFSDFHWKLEDYKEIAKKLNLQIEKIKELKSNQDLKIHGKNVLSCFQKNSIYMLLTIQNGKNKN
ncbi:MAG: class I SAM-dependent methyltransferase [Promethearchaeota archaeon]